LLGTFISLLAKQVGVNKRYRRAADRHNLPPRPIATE